MKKIAKIGASVLAIASLASCASKCDFAKFQEKVKGVEKSEYVTAVVKGTWKDSDGEKQKLNVNVDLTGKNTTLGNLTNPDYIAAAAIIAMTVGTYATVELKDATYYAGTTFKVVYQDEEDGKSTYTWNKCGLVTSINTGSSSVKVTYKK